NADHRMPVFKLADDERRSLALFLVGSQPLATTSEKPGRGGAAESIAAGKKMVETAGCAACHRIENLKANTSAVPTLARPIKDWTKACSQAGIDAKHIRPSYSFDENDRTAIRAFVESRFGNLSPESLFVHGGRLLRQKGCLSCHER